MPGSHQEIAAAAISGEIPDTWADGDIPTEAERDDILALRGYVERMRAAREYLRGEAQRRAMALLRSLLTREQRRQIGREKCFTATAPSGNRYRFFPGTGAVVRITKHGSRWFRHTSYCVHDERDDPDAMPPADLTVAHLLMIMADEPGFLATANARDMRDQLWNGDYLRRMRRRHQRPLIEREV